MKTETIIGQVATGNYFFPRPNVTEEFWKKINTGAHILISAPRRVGKTSLMYHFKDNPQNNYKLIYIITESVNTGNEFFKKLHHSLIEVLKGKTKIWKNITEKIKSKKISSIGLDGITIEDHSINYFEELVNLVKSIDFEDLKIVLMVDEFPQTVENIEKDESERNAVLFIQKNRELRQLPEINNKIQFVYTGSIGLENIVNRLNAMSSINDIYPLNVPPLTREETYKLIEKLTIRADWKLNNELIEYLTNKIGWTIPFYIQIIVDEIDNIERKNNILDNSVIDMAFEKAIRHRSYFEHWFTRLRHAFKGSEFNFTKDILNYISERNSINNGEIINIAIGYKIQETYKNLLNTLIHDGYINNHDNPKEYRFNSPLLKMWWNKNITN